MSDDQDPQFEPANRQLTFTPNQRATLLRYFYTASGSVGATLVAVGMDEVDVTRVRDVITNVGETTVAILGVLAVLTPIVASIIGAWRAGTAQQIHSVQKVAGVQVVVDATEAPSPAVRAALKNPNVKLKGPSP